jgi:hypothetical protein
LGDEQEPKLRLLRGPLIRHLAGVLGHHAQIDGDESEENSTVCTIRCRTCVDS